MAQIEKRKNKVGEITSYRIVVSGGFDYTGKRIKHTRLWKPEKKMTARQIDKALARAAADFEREIEQGFRTDDRQTFAEYVAYVIGLRERSGVKPRTIDRYNELLPRINAAIGHLKLADIRPQHLNGFYENLSETGVRAGADKAVAIIDLTVLSPLSGLCCMEQREAFTRTALKPKNQNDSYFPRNDRIAKAFAYQAVERQGCTR